MISTNNHILLCHNPKKSKYKYSLLGYKDFLIFLVNISHSLIMIGSKFNSLNCFNHASLCFRKIFVFITNVINGEQYLVMHLLSGSVILYLGDKR